MDRRGVLGLAATTAVGVSFPSARGFGQGSGSIGPEMNALSAYMSAAGARALPAEVAEHAKHHLLDTLASMVSGSGLLPGQAAVRYVRTRAGKGGSATIAGSTLTAAAVDAALANGVMAHADETDDSHNTSRSHPGCAVVPAALAVGEEFGIGGARLLRAVTLGYDIGTRVIAAMGGFEFTRHSSMSTHSIAGTFCAAAAAACAAGLDARQMRWALDYTAQQSSGIVAWRRDTDHIEKAFVFGGMPARNGATSALLVHSGWTGIDDIFTGDDNFFKAYAPKARPEQLVDKLGERFEVTLTDIKKWTVGSPIQGPLDAIVAIRDKRPFEADQVQRVTVRLAPSFAVVVDNRDIPDICLQHMVAVMLLDKTASFRAAHDKQRMKDTATLRQRAKVNLVADKELDKDLPVRTAVVEVTLADGTMLSERVTAVRGTPRNPMTRAEVIDKARDLVGPIVGREKSERLIKTVYAIDNVDNIRSLRTLLQPN
jgi:2-methylcitrate dehydratase PrpD